MKFLAVDYGQARRGIAVTDAEARMAFPRCTLLKDGREDFLKRLCALIAEEAPDAVVIGLPLYADGNESLATRQTRNFAARLKRRISVPLYFMPEVFSTCEAQADFRAAGRKPRKGELDRQAAVRILESFLNEDETRRNPV